MRTFLRKCKCVVIISMLLSLFSFSHAQNRVIGKGGEYTSADSTIARALKDTVHILIQFQQWEKVIPYAIESRKAYAAAFGEKYWGVGYMWGKIAGAHYHLGNYSAALEDFKKAIAITELTRPKSISMSGYYSNLGVLYNHYGNLPLAMEYSEKGLELEKELFGENSEAVRLSYLYLATHNLSLGNFRKSLDYNLQSLKLGIKLYGKDAPNIIDNYVNTASVYVELKNFDKANFYCLKAMDLIQKNPRANKQIEIPVLFEKLGKIEFLLGNYDKAMSYVNEMETFCKKNFPSNHFYFAYLYQLKANILVDGFHDLEGAKKCFEERLKIADNTLSRVQNLIMIGEMAFEDESYDEAIRFFKRSADSIATKELMDPINAARFHGSFAKIYFKKGDLQKVEEQLDISFDLLEFKKNSSPENVLDFSVLLSIFELTIDSYKEFYLKTKNETYLKLAEEYGDYALTIIDFHALGSNSIYQFAFAEEVHRVLTSAIGTQYIIFEKTKNKTDFQKALKLSERTKAYILRQALQQRQALREADDASYLFEKEEDLRLKITYLEKELLKRSKKNKIILTDNMMVQRKLQLSKLKAEYEVVSKELRTTYQEYF